MYVCTHILPKIAKITQHCQYFSQDACYWYLLHFTYSYIHRNSPKNRRAYEGATPPKSIFRPLKHEPYPNDAPRILRQWWQSASSFASGKLISHDGGIFKFLPPILTKNNLWWLATSEAGGTKSPAPLLSSRRVLNARTGRTPSRAIVVGPHDCSDDTARLPVS